MRTRERPIIAGTETDGRYYVSTDKGNTYRFDSATDAGAFFGSDLLTDLLIAEDEGTALAAACERSALRATRRDVYDILAAVGIFAPVFAFVTTVAYFAL